MARVCVVGNATKDVNKADLIASRRPGGTLLYASIALHRLGHDVHPIGHAPLTAYLAMRQAGLNVADVRLALRPTKFKNTYDNGDREQWARPGPGRVLDDGSRLDGHDAVLLGPVLGELPAGVEPPGDALSLLDVQGAIRRLGDPDLWGWQPVATGTPDEDLPRVDVVRGSVDELAPWLETRQPEQAAGRLRELTGANAVVTMGGEGALADDGQTHRAKPPRVEVDDPTGSGDVFDAGLLHALLEGMAMDEAVAFACGAAAAFLDRGEGVRVHRFPTVEQAEQLAP